MTSRAIRQPVIRGARFFLAHAPGLIIHGSKPSRDIARDPAVEHAIRAALRPWEAARDYAPNQVLIGARHPDSLRDLPRPWFEASPCCERRGPHGEITTEEELYGLLALGDQFDLVHLESTFAEDARAALAGNPLLDKTDVERLGGGVTDAAIDDRLRHIRLTKARHAHRERSRVAEPFEHVRMDGDRRNAVLLQRRGEPDDRRATGASKADAENRSIAAGRDRRAHLLVVGPGLLRRDGADIDRRQVL